MTALTLGRDQLAAWELLTGGWLLPLDGFASPSELAAGLPRVTLDVPADVGTSLVGQTVELREPEGVRLGTMDVAGAAPAPWAGEGMVHLHGAQAVDVPAVRYDHEDLRVTRDGAPDDVAIVIPSGRPLTLVELQGIVDRGRSRASLALVSLVGDAPADDTAMHTLVRAHRLHADRLRAGGVDVHHIVLPAPPPVDGEVPAVTALATSVLAGEHGRVEWPAAPVGEVDTDVAALLARRNPRPDGVGLTIFFTGLSGSGKSTVAGAVMARLHAETDRAVTLLDGDLVRQHLSSELSFSREHRDLNITRIGFVAAEITKHRGVAVCAPIAPYDATRRAVRDMVERHGQFVLVHVATPLEVCEARDRKGLYARARAGEIGSFTGISDPYEVPGDAELVLDTTDISIAAAAEQVMAALRDRGLLPPAVPVRDSTA